MNQSHAKKKRKFPPEKVLLYAAITVVLLLSWLSSGIFLIKVVAVIYLLYRTAIFIQHRTCFTCIKKFCIAGGATLLVIGVLPSMFYMGAIGILWLEPFL